MLRFWNRLIAMNEFRITKRIFTWFYDHSDNNWCMDIKRISTELDMLHIYDSKLFLNIRQAQEKCWDLMYMEWQNNVQNKPKLRLYRDIKLEFIPEPYVVKYVPKHARSLLAQIRLGILPLRIETGRFTNIVDRNTGLFRKMHVDERICTICDMNTTEDEAHFILHCTKYDAERQELSMECRVIEPQFDEFSDREKLQFLLNTGYKLLATYLIIFWNKRKDYMFN